MISTDVVERLLASTARLRILRQLYLFPEKGFTGREIARQARVSPRPASIALKQLLGAGLVLRRTLGRTFEWKFNKDSVVARNIGEVLVSLSFLRSRFMSELGKEIGKISGVKKAVIFGSVARNDDTVKSDLDIMIMVENAGQKKKATEMLLDLSFAFYGKYGTHISPIVYTKSEYERKKDIGLVRNIEKEGIEIFRAKK